METQENRCDAVKAAVKKYMIYLKNNSQSDAEKIKFDLHETGKTTVSYAGPEGKFTVKVNEDGTEAEANVKFTTGKFKAQIKDNQCTAEGVSPVFHQHWGHFHGVFSR